MAHDRQRQVFRVRPVRGTAAAWPCLDRTGRCDRRGGRLASASVGRSPRLSPAAFAASSPDQGGRWSSLMTRRAANRAPSVVGSRVRGGGGCSCAKWVGTARPRRFAVDGGEEIVLRQRGGMDTPDCGIADMKVGREPSSLQRRRAEGSRGRRRRAVPMTERERADGLARRRVRRERKQRTAGEVFGDSPSRRGTEREDPSKLNQYSYQ